MQKDQATSPTEPITSPKSPTTGQYVYDFERLSSPKIEATNNDL